MGMTQFVCLVLIRTLAADMPYLVKQNIPRRISHIVNRVEDRQFHDSRSLL